MYGDFNLTHLGDQDHLSGPAFAASDWPAQCLATSAAHWGSTAAHWGWRPHQIGAGAPVELIASSVPELQLQRGRTGLSCHDCTRAGLASEQAGVQALVRVPGAAVAG